MIDVSCHDVVMTKITYVPNLYIWYCSMVTGSIAVQRTANECPIQLLTPTNNPYDCRGGVKEL